MRIAVLLLLVAAGCGKADEALKALESVQSAVCGCKPGDVACQQAGVAKIAEWHTKHDEVMGARSQAAKATAAAGAMTKCQTNQLLAGIAERAGCKAKPDGAWCRFASWGDAKAVKAEDLPFGKTLTGEMQRLTIGEKPTGAVEDGARIEIGGDAKAPTANGAPMKAAGAGWKYEYEQGFTAELRHVDKKGWMSLSIDGDTRHVGVFDE